MFLKIGEMSCDVAFIDTNVLCQFFLGNAGIAAYRNYIAVMAGAEFRSPQLIGAV